MSCHFSTALGILVPTSSEKTVANFISVRRHSEHPMTLDYLIAEGRRLQRDCIFLKPQGPGEPVARWLEPDPDDESITGFKRWLTLRADALPNPKAPSTVFFSVYTKGNGEGVVDFVDGWPPVQAIPLFAHPASVLAPADALFAFGSDKVGEWLAAINWPRTERPTSNFPDWELLSRYDAIWQAEHPVFHDDPAVYSITGGWHMPTQWNDWHELADAKLLVTTVRDAEPWVEVFQLPDGDIKVIERCT